MPIKSQIGQNALSHNSSYEEGIAITQRIVEDMDEEMELQYKKVVFQLKKVEYQRKIQKKKENESC